MIIWLPRSIDSDIKKQCESLYGELGVSLTAAINVFLRQSLPAGGFLSMFARTRNNGGDPSVKRYSNVEEALKE